MRLCLNLRRERRVLADGKAVGIFDSGVGGLTVVRQLRALMPNESLLYLGDTARVPYGTKSPDTVIRYAEKCAALLVERGVKLLIVACNTASAFAVQALTDSMDIPVVGVIHPGAREAVLATRIGKVGVIGTVGTVGSGAYQRAIASLREEIEVVARPCPLFVPLAEEGWVRGPVPEAVAKEYLTPMIEAGVDTLVLGCTHYPLLADTVAKTMGPRITLVDSASAVARQVQEVMRQQALCVNQDSEGTIRFLVSDAPDSFRRTGQQFLGHDLDDVEWVDF